MVTDHMVDKMEVQCCGQVEEGVTNTKRMHGLKIPVMFFESAFRREVLVTINHNISFYAGTVCRLLTDLGAFEDARLCCPPTLV